MIYFLSAFLFAFFFLAAARLANKEAKAFGVFMFLIASVLIRFLIDPSLNKDYTGYIEHEFKEPESLFSFFTSEPYLYILYNFFHLFSESDSVVFKMIYWFNFSINTSFFLWLAIRADVALWKKMLIFTFYYFLFGFVLLRNGPAYLMFGYFFYKSYRGHNSRALFASPFMHLSTLPLLLVYMNKVKHYFRWMFVLSVLLTFVFLFFFQQIVMWLISDATMTKFEVYSEGSDSVGIFHHLFLLFFTSLFFIAAYFYKRRVLHPILITTLLCYYLAFMFNPVMGFRYSPYFLLALLLFDDGQIENLAQLKIINWSSILLLPYFLFTLSDTHLL